MMDTSSINIMSTADLSQYQWVPIFSTVVAFFCAFGIGSDYDWISYSIGANDVANAFGTSVGAKAITMKNAMVIAGIFEFLGSFLMGSNVTETIQKGISDPMMFKDEPETLMFGMCCVLIGVAAWLIIATLYSLPVSTTHSCIGGLVGMALVAKGPKAVKWNEIAKVIASWFVSPVLSGLLTVFLFWIVRKYILRSNDSFKNAFRFYPIIIGFTLFVLAYFMMNKGIPQLDLGLPWSLNILIAIAIGVALALILTYTAVPYLKKRIEKEMKLESETAGTTISIPIDTPKDVEMKDMTQTEGPDQQKAVPVETSTVEQPKKEVNTITHQNIHAELSDEKSKVYQIHQRAEKFDPHTERIFSYLQVLTATLNSFAHGANDVANSIGPLASIIAIYNNNGITENAGVDTWVLVVGGVGIVVGLACLGYKVMAAIGVNMVTVTPSRGFAIEIGSAFVIVTGSQLGLPLSTTHCQVGSTVGVGMMEGKGSVNWKLVFQVFVGWVVTLLVCGLTTAGIFAFGMYSPSKF